MASVETLVSVHIISYNHEKYIEQAITSVLAQKVNFKYEIVIGDDFSQDGTREIITRFAQAHPAIIKPLLHSHNLGPVGLAGKNNFFTTLQACTGKYVAILDGDDYWMDDHKLQKQVDTLEADPSISICGHSTNYLFDDSVMTLSDLSVPSPKRKKIEDAGFGIPCHVCSILFRNIYKTFPDWIYKTKIGDWPLIALLMAKGDLVILPEAMSVYRQNSGLWSSTPRLHQVNGIVETINYMFNAAEFASFPGFRRNLTQTKIQYLKELHATENNSGYVSNEDEIGLIDYYEGVVNSLQAAFRNNEELAARVPLGMLIRALSTKFIKKISK